uniref:Fe2OG dioxygenase domain-containing protein n=1 Tax=Haptolina brevifila TaxID=156173 RepID=A0A7S2MDY2_9EUKA|mmetsp:Transcript_50018/g.99634  ORF Transcript_50018/g.99634 Transcript_50018/m.99634 type:complete len:403 (+) Transcript_50018:112-1320(+)|eukprot:CAMPEP_0174725628 /NCGR_PEP_ID=MMETSP1094-20130205/46056_1 /TAXON_ID=156173 /ORGANISM="Chrysochromulina brevifilum, Strain UTEX LB 985" /LENGTH=402 /DNA_ID=CAMNT_0015927069 /DNA_START=83 /DNA_END=1291 /DNA_ORIENTATION=-
MTNDSSTTLSLIRDGAWLARHLLTPKEQLRLRKAAEAQVMPPAAKDNRLRDCQRTELMDEELSQRMWQRLQRLVPETVIIDKNSADIGLPASETLLHGTWHACGINPLFRIVRYAGNGIGHFGPHRDGAFEKSLGERSLLTINGYLNELPEGAGGCTRFVDDNQQIHMDEQGRFTTPDSAVTHRVRPEAGCGVVFFHGLMHDGEPLTVGAPPKWLFRTEVMYKRDPQELEAISPEDAEARRLDVLAESVERADAMAACELNKLSLKLCERRITVEAARLKAAPLLQELREVEELKEEVSNALMAQAETTDDDAIKANRAVKAAATAAGATEAAREMGAQIAGEQHEVGVPVPMPVPVVAREQVYACTYCRVLLLKADFIGHPVGCMDSELTKHATGKCNCMS